MKNNPTRGLTAALLAYACVGTSLAAELEEVIVTGERITRSLKDTAASVAVNTAEDLAAQAAPDRIEQVLAYTPNVQLGASDQGPSIRGQESTGVLQGADAFLGGTRPRATLQVDGRALSYNEFIYGLASVWDVKRVEVFRTPQTTTQGRNSIAGAIFMETNDPTYEFEGRVRALAGAEDTRQGSAVVSGPLVDEQVAGRLAVDVREHTSWVNYTGEDNIEGADRSEDDYKLVRGKLLVEPAALGDLSLKLTYAHLESNNPQGEAIQAPFEDRSYDAPDGGYWETRVDSLVADLNYALSSDAELTVITAFGDSTIDRLSSPGGGVARVESQDLSIEARLSVAPAGSSLAGLVGVYGLTTDQDEAIDLSAFLGFGDFTDEQTSLGLFGEATWTMTERLALTAGARFQRDHQDRVGSLGLCDPEIVCFRVDYDETFEAFLPKVALKYDVTRDWRLGALAQRGFNPGGTTISFETGAQDFFDEETLWTYEVFSRSGHLDGRLFLMLNAFYSSFDDSQRPLTTVVTRPDGSIAFVTEIDNAPSARSYGLEGAIQWAANDQLTFKLGLGLLETEIEETLDPADPIRGGEFQRAPNFSAALGVSWRPIQSLAIDLNARSNADYFSDDANTAALKIDGTTVLDAQLRWEWSNFQATAYARNATDEFYMTQLYSPTFGTAGDPREYGVSLEARF